MCSSTSAVIGRCWKPSQQIYKQSLALKEFSQSIFFVQKKAFKCKMLFHCLLQTILPTPLCEFWHVTVPNHHAHMRRIWNLPIRNIHAYVFATLQDIRTSFCTLIRGQTIHSSGLDDVLASCNTGYYVTDQENNKNSYPQHSYSSPKIWGIHEINDICFLN